MPSKDIIFKDRAFLIFLAFIVIQPFLDYYFLFEESIKRYTIISPATIIRVIYIIIIFSYLWFSYIQKERLFKYITIYFAVLLVYIVVHTLICNYLPVTLPTHFRYNIKDEIVYLVRIILPIMLLIITWKMPLKLEHVRRITLALVYIIGATMIISNLLGFSLVAYHDTLKLNDHTFLSWFTREYANYQEISSKGLFYKGNQISGVLLLLMPINLMFFIRRPTVTSFISNILQIFCMFMLSSRVGVYGVGISIVVVLAVSSICWLKDKRSVRNLAFGLSTVFIIFYIGILPFSPYVARINSDQAAKKKSALTNNMDIKEGIEPAKEQSHDNLEIKLSKLYIPSYYYNNIYPIASDVEFWSETSSLPIEQINDSRKQQKLITKRIYDRIDKNKWVYSLMGMGRSRLANGDLLIESDVLVQRYTLGWLGLILFFGPFVIIILFCGIKILQKFKLLFTHENTSILFAVALFWVAAFASGHLIDELFPILLCVFFLGFISKHLIVEHYLVTHEKIKKDD